MLVDVDIDVDLNVGVGVDADIDAYEHVWDRAHICHGYHGLYLWRKNCHVEKFLYRIWTIYGVLSKFMLFLLQIYVEKNVFGESLWGEKMTNMRSVWAVSFSQESCSKVEFVHAVNANGSVKFLPAV